MFGRMHTRKWERCDLGGKHRARYCHLLLAPPFRLTPNEAKGGSPYKRVSMALKLLKCFFKGCRCGWMLFKSLKVFYLL